MGSLVSSELHTRTLDALRSSWPEETLSSIRAFAHAESAAWLEFAKRNDCAPIVASALSEACGRQPEAEFEAWWAVRDANAERMTVLMSSLDEVAAKLARAQIRLVALKNAGIARGVYPNLAASPMGDIDVLVSKSSFLDAHKLVLECGFEHSKRAEIEDGTLEEALIDGGAEYVKRVGEHEVWLELQWRAVSGRAIGKSQEPDTDELLEASVAIPGSEVRLLEPSMNMLQVALHTAKHSFMRAPGLRLHTDVERLAAHCPPDWDRVVELATRLTVRTPAFFSFALAKTLLHADVPDFVLEALKPKRRKVQAVCRQLRKRNVFEPNEKKFSRAGMIHFHSLLFDDTRGWLASALGTEREDVRVLSMPKLAWKALPRIKDLLFRFQR